MESLREQLIAEVMTEYDRLSEDLQVIERRKREHQRLKDALCVAAKAWAKSFEPESPDIADLEIALQQAAINLIEFEELHQQ